MSNKLPKAVIISNDTNLQKRLESNQPTKKRLLSVVLSSKLLSISSAIDADAYLYDVGLNNDNVSTTLADISNLKRSIFNKPLILIGEKYQLNQILDQENINGLVSETINKPVSNGQLLLAINSYSSAKKSRQLQILAIYLGAFLLLFYMTYVA